MMPKKERDVTAYSKIVSIITDIVNRCLICKPLPVYF